MIKSIDIEAVDTRTHGNGNAQDQQTIIGAVVHGEVEAGGISFTYSAQLNALELTGLDGILLSVDRRMREALGLNRVDNLQDRSGNGRQLTQRDPGYQPKVER